MTRTALVLATCAALALAACNRSDPAADAPNATTAAPVDAMAADPAAPPPFVSADAPKPAGTFSPADIAGVYVGDGSLELKADGSYVQTGGAHAEDGTWAADATDAARIRLDPNSKTAQDRVLQVAPDALTPVAGDNAAAPSSTPFTRQAAS